MKNDLVTRTPLRVLLAEQPGGDARCLLERLERGGHALCWRRLDDEADLAAEDWDVLLAAGKQRAIAGLRAGLRHAGVDKPLVAFLPDASDDDALDAMRAGARDVVTGRSPARLLAILEREARDAHERAARRQAQLETRRGEERLHALLQNALGAVAILGADGTVQVASPSAYALLGYAPGAAAELTAVDLVHPDDLPELRKGIRATGRAPGSALRTELRLRHHDGSWRHLDAIIRDLREDDAVRGIVVHAIDITERRRAEAALSASEEQLRASQRLEAVGRLAGGIAHDFNNILMAITGHAELMLDDLDPRDRLREDVLEIQRNVERAASLTRQLLAFSRRQVLQARVLDINQVIRDVERTVRRLIGEDVAFVTSLAPELWNVKADPGQFEQVLINLAVNAREAMPRGGQISITTANVTLAEHEARAYGAPMQPGDYVRVAFTDTGCGIPRAVLPYIFEPFYTTKERGTGLGLSTVYGIVKQSGGYIWARSEEDAGATFEVFLPRALGERQAAAAPAPCPSCSDGAETVLLVEDEPAVRAMAERILRRRGYTVLVAQNGGEAILLGRRHEGPIHLLIADVVMPLMSGREVADFLAPLRPEMRVLYMSGYTDDAIVHHGVLNAGVHFIEKPCSPEMLARKVREVLDLEAEVVRPA